MIETSAALSALASAVAPPPPVVDRNVRAPAADQAQGSVDRKNSIEAIRYFRFNLKYDALDQQLYFVFKNPVTGAVVDEAPSVRSVRSAMNNRSTAVSEASSSQSAGKAAGSGDGSSAPSPATKAGAPSTQGAPGAPSASGPSAGSEASRGSAVDSRI